MYPRARPAVDVGGSIQRRESATVAANGTATVDISPTSNWAWSVTQVSIEIATAPVGATCVMRLDGTFVTALIPTGDVAAGDPPVLVQPGQTLRVAWSGCTPGTVGTVLVFYDEVSA